jgi:hypothetical protein
VLSGRGLCDGPIPRPEESYRLWCVSECAQVKINNLDTCCEQVGRRGKDYERKILKVRHWRPIQHHLLPRHFRQRETRPSFNRLPHFEHWVVWRYVLRSLTSKAPQRTSEIQLRKQLIVVTSDTALLGSGCLRTES